MEEVVVRTIPGASDRTLLDAIGRLRVDVWASEGQAIPEASASGRWHDAHDDHALHVVALDQGELIAASRVCVHDDLVGLPDHEHFSDLAQNLRFPLATLTRLVVVAGRRRRQLSWRLDDVRLAAARELGARAVLAESSPQRVQSLARRGFRVLRSRSGVRFPALEWTTMVCDL